MAARRSEGRPPWLLELRFGSRWQLSARRDNSRGAATARGKGGGEEPGHAQRAPPADGDSRRLLWDLINRQLERPRTHALASISQRLPVGTPRVGRESSAAQLRHGNVASPRIRPTRHPASPFLPSCQTCFMFSIHIPHATSMFCPGVATSFHSFQGRAAARQCACASHPPT